jgi:antitoxin VapB
MLVDPYPYMAYTYVYAKVREGHMQRTAKVFMNNRSQAVRLPKEFQFSTKEVFIRKQGHEVILSALPKDWSELLSPDAAASKEFMKNVEKLSVQERAF